MDDENPSTPEIIQKVKDDPEIDCSEHSFLAGFLARHRVLIARFPEDRRTWSHPEYESFVSENFPGFVIEEVEDLSLSSDELHIHLYAGDNIFICRAGRLHLPAISETIEKGDVVFYRSDAGLRLKTDSDEASFTSLYAPVSLDEPSSLWKEIEEDGVHLSLYLPDSSWEMSLCRIEVEAEDEERTERVELTHGVEAGVDEMDKDLIYTRVEEILDEVD